MIAPIIVNMDVNSYVKLLVSIQKQFQQLLKDLESLSIDIKQHPSETLYFSSKQELLIQKHFPFEIQKYGNIQNFYQIIVLVNYHMGSFALLSHNNLNLTDIASSISIAVEDIIKLQSFGNK